MITKPSQAAREAALAVWQDVIDAGNHLMLDRLGQAFARFEALIREQIAAELERDAPGCAKLIREGGR